ncbi:DNA-directed RNA polymerase [Paenibacillus odorifer]|uniref:helix-turn-helix domain-containing protein n=1 Tax=Paenibacillus TaxID=44249 RepID=UPI00096C3756|nr:helix-turn-helix domain-containing protein [Paenibacillus odorifer]OME13241.1 DNA-directed RNA polymerase [Paenibacillus odorifer]OME45441.1 DNA-directed RNA polymerase [Paenibacillus odorifer]
MQEIGTLIELAQSGNRDAEARLIFLYQPLINKFAKQNGHIDEDCRQHLTLEFILAVRRFNLNRYR